MEVEPCFSCGDEQVSDEYQRWNGHRYSCVCGASGPFCRTREQALIEWNRVAIQRWRPINTAKEGERYLLYSPATRMMPAYMEVRDWPFGRATHYRFLPEPPNGETDGD